MPEKMANGIYPDKKSKHEKGDTNYAFDDVETSH